MSTIREQISGTQQADDPEPPEEAYTDVEQQTAPQQQTGQSGGPQQQTGQSGWLDLLQAETPAEEIHQRHAMNKAGQAVMVNGQPLTLDYVTARFVQDRLDAAVGPMNWQSVFESLPDGSVRAGIGIRDPQWASRYGWEQSDRPAEWVWKWDVGVPSSIEPSKGAHSDAFKRAGVQWGIARDLYDDRDEKVMQQPAPQAMTTAHAPVQQQMVDQQHPAQGGGAYPPQQYMEDGQPPAWVCPVHDDVKVVPAGVSKKPPFRAYDAFYACPVPGCDQKAPRGLKVVGS